MDSDVVSVERVVGASAGEIFALLSDADKHQAFDGSGTVRGAFRGGGAPLRMGSTFGTSMNWGLPYRTVSEVVEFEQDRRIAWQTRGAGPLRHLIGGRIWRYELEAAPNGTLVRESWDLSQDKQAWLIRRSTMPAMTKRNMRRSLERLEQAIAATP